MNIKHMRPGLLVVLIIAGIYGLKSWQTSNAQSTPVPTRVSGPAIILFRGDNSTNCRAIDHLVDQAARRYQGRISVVQTDWSTDNPLISKYRIRFLPAVIFVDSKDNEIGRIIGESPAVQKKLAQALNQAPQLLLGPVHTNSKRQN